MQMKQWGFAMKKIIIILLIIVLILVMGIYLFLRTGLPDYSSSFKVPGLASPVTIERNKFAVPTITAQNMDDLYFAWGYVNAQDRLFQMEFTKRVGQGRISEFAGEEALSKDYFLRAVGFYERAKAYTKKLSPYYKRLCQRYADGVNYYIETKGRNAYMLLLGMKKEKWEIADSVLVGMMLNWSLAYNMKYELLYHKIVQKIGKDKASLLLNFVPPDTPTVIGDSSGRWLDDEHFSSLLKEFDWLFGCRSASNNWAVAPQLTSHGKAILCSDMQVHQSKLPNDFYLIHVKTGDFEVAGAQVTGLPFIASGFNKHCAWGLTNQGADMVDLFKERIDWKAKRYHYNGKWLPLKNRKEVFAIKGKQPIAKTMYYAGKKPVLNEVFKDLDFDVSLDWTGFDAIALEGFFMINAAKNFDEFMEGAKQIRMSPQNLVYADDKGNIAFRVIGSLPVRKKGTGNFIQDGEKIYSNWNGNIPDDKYPMLKNPERGYIATANNLNAADYPYELNGTYAPGYRYENIAMMLRNKKDLDVNYMKKMQTDTHTVLAKKVKAILKKFIHRDALDAYMQKAFDRVIGWDADSSKDSIGASVYNTFYVRFAYQTLVDELGDTVTEEYVSERYISMERFFEMVEKDSMFFDDVRTNENETVADIAQRAFKETCQLLCDYFGTDNVEKWQWGKIHSIKFDHILGMSALLKPLVNYGPFPFEGDGETNNRAKFLEVAPPFIADLASAPRIIVKFTPQPEASMMLITGENEHFLSKHNTDMVDAWLDHVYFELGKEEVSYSMKLIPEK